MTEVSTGTVLSDRYRLDSELGRGGMGVVYKAEDQLLDRPVAIKVLSALALGTEGQQQLLGEAQAIAKLNHPQIVAVHDVGEIDGTPYIVMELVEGVDLHRHPPESLEDTAAVSRQVAAALQHAHAQGVIHRDLKPENVLVQPDGTAKLVDFGIARSVASRLTAEGQITGTAFYMAPEYALGQEIDGRADLYSLGVMLYELTTDTLPFAEGDPLTIISQHVHAEPVPPHVQKPEIPPRLESLTLELLSKDPDDRPASAGAVVQALNDPELLDPMAATDSELAVLRRIAHGRFVGRRRELKQARSIWMRAKEGESQTLLISGEPGIGKSRLTRELMTQAEVSGGNVFIGECYAEGGAPYSPFSQMLRRALPQTSENGSAVPEFVVADLLSLAPELRPYYPALPEVPPLDPESEQRRLFESAVSLFTGLSDRAPVLLVIEDAHWADSGSLSMLRYLARRTRDKPVMLVATYREVELDESRPLQEMLLEMNRERLATRLKLGRFSREDTRELLAAIFQEEITDEFLQGIHNETEGNPFFIEELCKSLVEEGKIYFEDGRWHRPEMGELDLPQSVRVAIQSRLAQQREGVQNALRMAAILGYEFDFDTLVAASDLNEDGLVDSLESAERAQLVSELSGERGGTFRFAHALIASTLLEGLSGLRRRRMHHQAATAIEQLRPEDFEALAHHYFESGDLEEALAYSLKAGERAIAFSAMDEALHQYGRALEIAEAQELTDELTSILETIGDAEANRDFNKSVAAYERALTLTSDRREEAALKAKIGAVSALKGDESGLPLLDEAIEGLDPKSQGGELARAIASIGRYHHNRGQHREALEHLNRAREIAEPLGDAQSLALIYPYLSGAYQNLAEFEASLAWARASIEFGERENQPLMVAAGYEYHAENYNSMGFWEQGQEYAVKDLEIGQKTGFLDRVAWARWCLMLSSHGLGELGTAIEEGTQSLEMAETHGDLRLAVLVGAFMAILLAETGDDEGAQSLAEQAVQRTSEIRQVYIACSALSATAYLHALRGDWELAYEAHTQCEASGAKSDGVNLPMYQEPGYAEACLETGRPEQVPEIIRKSLEIARDSGSPVPEAEALRVRARYHAAENNVDEALEDFTEAVRLCEKQNSKMLLGRTLLDWGRLHASLGDLESADPLLERAQKIFKDAGAAYWVARVNTIRDELALVR